MPPFSDITPRQVFVKRESIQDISKGRAYMARKSKRPAGGQDAFKNMYDRELKKFQSMDQETDYSNTPDDLRFYSEAELEAIEQAKRDAARQAYEDAYLDEYNRVRAGVRQNDPQRQGQPQRQARPRPADNRASAPIHPNNQKYAEAARRKHSGEQVQFGNKNEYINSGKGRREMKGGSAVGKFFRGLFIIILVIVLLMQLLIFRYISLVNSVETGDRLVTDAALYSKEVTNILLIGSDTRDEEERGRTDSMILLSINRGTKEITLTSLMRDSYVEIPEHGWDKLNAAYRYGGAELLMDTVEHNLDVRVDRYAYVSFFSFIEIVDAVGGIDIDLSDEEAQGMTDPMAEQNKYLGNEKGTDYLTSGGKGVHLNGNQALAYARLRYVGNADFERTERQRTVITKIIDRAKTLDPLALDNFLKVCAKNLTTNMNKTEMYVFFYKLLFSIKYEMSQLRIPPEDAYYYGSHDGQSTLDLDLDACRRELEEKIYK